MTVPPHVCIATETEEVVREIKSTRSILNDTIEPFPDLLELEKFAVYHYWADSESVNVFQVVGTASEDCIGMAWIDLLKKGSKMHLNLSMLASNPDYYFSPQKKQPTIHYTKIDGKIYVSSEGSHRTAIAKVLFYYTGCYILHGVDYNEYLIDHEMLNLYQEIKQKLLKKFPYVTVEPIKEFVKREDTAGWKKDYFNLFLKVRDYKTKKEKLLTKADARRFLEELNSTGLLKRLFKILPL